MTSIIEEYRRRTARGELTPDDAQLALARRLDRLCHELSGYRPQRREARWWRMLQSKNGQPARSGLYLWGGVGRGKTMLMDLLHECAPLKRKRRVHFHQFMQEVHQALHAIRHKQRSGHVWEDADPVALVCEAIAAQATLLCFDEFQVTDITDAMILGRLFEALLNQGVVIVATSNTPPDALYRDGLNRDAFVPFIAMLKAKLDVVALTGPTDYRLGHIAGQALYVTPLGASAERHLDRLWRELTIGAEERPRSLLVGGRELEVPRAAGGVARFEFAELCQRPLGPADYIALAEAFHTVILSDVPQLPRECHNEARRLSTLIDTLYDRGVRLVVSAATPPEAIYPEARGGLEFARTVSRLHQMCSQAYWQGHEAAGEGCDASTGAAPSRLAAGTHPG